ncbi:cytochrome d ubiquinol oxidase subunit II [Alteromonas oceanisediminis]|uniref:cytochrome d ubiquinol oxidase subunit II n=1 Tax=Alteromonas oceanisediminis TaxID=2836180 RepID=UPI001BD9D621|nr:cytochrome d ubiquinol oxidase subunit II [Alteromonas oceanisediminis]MBT0586157.1 cytochrome d ubiquinol oxidase subunit II [Alteromonas oceanisediminis]
MIDWLFADENLPLVFAVLMALSVILYAVLDGYDLGVGLLLPMDNAEQRDSAIASIGPFWDANETWLVLAIGLLLVAFPAAHSEILHALYLPATFMLIGLILRGVAFDFRAKVSVTQKRQWDYLFKLGSLIATLTQGFVLGMFVMGFEYTVGGVFFSILSAFGVATAYALIGSTWLIMKSEGELHRRALRWAKYSGAIAFAGILAVCFINPLINSFVLERWTTIPMAYFIGAIPLLCFSMFAVGYQVLKRLPLEGHRGDWVPFLMTVVVFLCCFAGLALSFYPYVVPGQLTIYETASAPESLRIMLVGALLVLPMIAGYTVFAYTTFRGKTTALRYY